MFGMLFGIFGIGFLGAIFMLAAPFVAALFTLSLGLDLILLTGAVIVYPIIWVIKKLTGDTTGSDEWLFHRSVTGQLFEKVKGDQKPAPRPQDSTASTAAMGNNASHATTEGKVKNSAGRSSSEIVPDDWSLRQLVIALFEKVKSAKASRQTSLLWKIAGFWVKRVF